MNWDVVSRHKGWKQSLMGLTRSHTRGMYKSDTYRKGCMLDFEDNTQCTIIDENECQTPTTKNAIIAKYSPCMWCPNYHIKRTNYIHNLFYNIEKECIHLQSSNMRKCHKNKGVTRYSYITELFV